MGKSKKVTVGYHYEVALHDGLCLGPLDAFLEFRPGTKTAWAGRITASTTININQPDLWGGKKDQGGVVGPLAVMFGEPTQLPNAYLTGAFGNQTVAWRGIATVAFEGGRYGANNPWPQKRAYKVERIKQGWDAGCWYEAKAAVPLSAVAQSLVRELLVTGTATSAGGPVWATAYASEAPQFVSVPVAANADLASGLPAYYGQWWVVAGGNAVRYYRHGLLAFQIGAADTFGGVPRDIVGGASGFLIHNNGLYPLQAASTPPAVFTALTSEQYEEGNAWPSGLVSSYHSFGAGGVYYVAYNRAVWRATAPSGPFALICAASTLEGDPNGSMLQNWWSICEGGAGRLWAVTDQNFSLPRRQVRYSDDGGVHWYNADIVVDRASGASYRPLQVIYTGTSDTPGHVVASALDNAVWTSANGWAEPIDIGLTAGGSHHMAAANGRVYIVSGNKGVSFNPATLEVSEQFTLPIGNVAGIAAGPAPAASGSFAENPAHAIVWAHTQEHCGAQPLATVNAASAQAAADWFYAQGFGICTLRYPDKESAAEFIRRVERVAGCSWTQNRADGQWYIDIANGQYTLADLPILNDDDIVAFEEVPTVLDEAVNSVSVKYFDPQRKEAITTPPLRAMGLVAEFGTIHQTYEFPELPTDALANRVANRELLARCTPTRVFTLVTTRKTAGWRRNTYFRLQSPKRGIADMVCLLAEVNDGSLKSGAVQIKATQDIYSLPTTVYTETEQGVDTRPPSEPVPAAAQVVFEAPYIDVVAAMPRAEFAALPPDVGFAAAAAGNPGGMVNFTMRADAGAGYQSVATGDFCKTAVLAAELLPGKMTGIALESAASLASVVIGTACIMGGEWCRVDAIDAVANTIDLGRGCADTLPAQHAAGMVIYFYADDAASDATEYTDGETIGIKLLPRTGSKQLADADATALPLTFARRMAREYPPAQLQINGVSIFDVATVTVVSGSDYDEVGP